MPRAQLGSTDLNVSRLCFGCWQLSPSFWGDIDIKPWEQSIHAAVDSGVNFLDTADAYGNGYAEEQLGRLMQTEKLRDKFIIATKFYFPKHLHP